MPALTLPSPRSCLALFLACLTLAGCSTFEGESYPKPSDYPIHGIDVSKYQGEVDWQAVANSGVRFAWIKATEGGDYADPVFERNWAGAKAAGLARGAYHFAYWCRPAVEQLEWFKAHVPRDDDALPPVLDVEWNGHSTTCPKKVSREQARAEMRVILAGIEAYYGKKPVIYTSVDFHKDVMEGDFDDHSIWVRSVKHFPTVRYGERRWYFWQYTAEGRIAGIKGLVDKNAFFGSEKEWSDWRDGKRLDR